MAAINIDTFVSTRWIYEEMSAIALARKLCFACNVSVRPHSWIIESSILHLFLISSTKCCRAQPGSTPHARKIARPQKRDDFHIVTTNSHQVVVRTQINKAKLPHGADVPAITSRNPATSIHIPKREQRREPRRKLRILLAPHRLEPVLHRVIPVRQSK